MTDKIIGKVSEIIDAGKNLVTITLGDLTIDNEELDFNMINDITSKLENEELVAVSSSSHGISTGQIIPTFVGDGTCWMGPGVNPMQPGGVVPPYTPLAGPLYVDPVLEERVDNLEEMKEMMKLQEERWIQYTKGLKMQIAILGKMMSDVRELLNRMEDGNQDK